MTFNKFNEKIRKYIFPSYNENTLFLIAVSFLALSLLNSSFRSSLLNIFPSKNNLKELDRELFYYVIFGFLFISGFILSIYHAFTNRTKSAIEKTFMLFFALLMNGIAGVSAGLYILKNTKGLLLIFPIWNILNGILLVYLIGLVNEECIENRNIISHELLISSVIAGVLFIFCNFIYHLHWAITFSIITNYAMSFNEPILNLWNRKKA